MATRFYFGKILTDTVPPFYEVSLGGPWQPVATTVAVRALMRTVKTKSFLSSTPFVQQTTEAVVGAFSNALCAQFISRPLAAQTITGTFKGYALFSEGATNQDSRVWCQIRIVPPTGGIRGLLFSSGGVLSSEFNVGTATNRRIPVLAETNTLTSVTAVAGDFLVVEIGFRTDASGVTSNITFQWHDDPATGDLPEDETTTTASLAPWIEFSQTLIVQDQFDYLFPPSTDSIGVSDLSPVTALTTQTAAVDFLAEFGPPALPVPLIERQTDYLAQQTLGDVATSGFDDTAVRQFTPGAIGVPDLSPVTALTTQTVAVDILAEFGPPALPVPLIERQANQITDNTNPTFLAQQTLGDVATSGFDDTAVRQFTPGAIGVSAVTALPALVNTVSLFTNSPIADFAPTALTYNLVEPSQDSTIVRSLVSSTRYINRVYSTTVVKFVRWVTDTVPDPTGNYYPGPGAFGVTTLDYVVEYSYTV